MEGVFYTSYEVRHLQQRRSHDTGASSDKVRWGLRRFSVTDGHEIIGWHSAPRV